MKTYLPHKDRKTREDEYADAQALIKNAMKSAGVPVPGMESNILQPEFTMPTGAPGLPGEVATANSSVGDPDLEWLISKESSGRTDAQNPTSTAFGLGQLLEANRELYGNKLGFSPTTTDYNQQLAMMKAYIADRYGSSAAARKFHESKGWY